MKKELKSRRRFRHISSRATFPNFSRADPLLPNTYNIWSWIHPWTVDNVLSVWFLVLNHLPKALNTLLSRAETYIFLYVPSEFHINLRPKMSVVIFFKSSGI